MDCSPPGSSVRGISQARTQEWVAISFPRGSSQPRHWTLFFCTGGRFFTTESPGKPLLPLTQAFPTHPLSTISSLTVPNSTENVLANLLAISIIQIWQAEIKKFNFCHWWHIWKDQNRVTLWPCLCSMNTMQKEYPDFFPPTIDRYSLHCYINPLSIQT